MQKKDQGIINVSTGIFPNEQGRFCLPFAEKKDLIPLMTAPKEHCCQFSIKLPSQCRRKTFDQCGPAKTLWSMFLPEKSNQTFCFHPQKSAAWFCRNLGAIFELMSQELDKKITTKSLWGRQQGEFLQKNISLHGIANDRFFSIKRKPGKFIDASH